MNVIVARARDLMVVVTVAAQVDHVICLLNVTETMGVVIEEISIKVQCEVQVRREETVSAHINLINDKIYIRISPSKMMMILCKMRIFR